MTQTAKNFLPTSMPAHRSIIAGIIGLLVLKPDSAYPFTSCSASRSSFQGAFHAGRTRFIFGAFATTTQKGSPAPAPLFSLKLIAGVFIPQGGRRPCVVHPWLNSSQARRLGAPRQSSLDVFWFQSRIAAQDVLW